MRMGPVRGCVQSREDHSSLRVTFLVLVTRKLNTVRPDDDPLGGLLRRQGLVIVMGPVRLLLRRICTMLPGRSGSDLPLAVTPWTPIGRRITRLVRFAAVSTLTISRICLALEGWRGSDSARTSARVLVGSSQIVAV